MPAFYAIAIIFTGIIDKLNKLRSDKEYVGPGCHLSLSLTDEAVTPAGTEKLFSC